MDKEEGDSYVSIGKPPGCRASCPRTRRLVIQELALSKEPAIIKELAFSQESTIVQKPALSKKPASSRLYSRSQHFMSQWQPQVGLSLSRHCRVRSRHTATLKSARKVPLPRRRSRRFGISPSRHASMTRRQATWHADYQDDKVYLAYLHQAGNPPSSQHAAKPKCHHIS